MTRLKNHICGALLLCCLSAPYLLFLYFSASRLVIRHEMEEALESSMTETLVIAAKDFVWYEEDREIIYQEQMFDVKSIEASGDSLVVRGLFDEKETLVKKQLEKFDGKQQSASTQHFLQSMVLTAWMQQANEVESPFCLEPGKRVLSPESSLYHSFLTVLTPPPRFFIV